MGEPVKYIDIKEFREQGYLQELNRRFLHPLGLALEVKVENCDNCYKGVVCIPPKFVNRECEECGGSGKREALGGVWDYRDDPEGMNFAVLDREKYNRVQQEWNEKTHHRKQTLGYKVQSITGEATK